VVIIVAQIRQMTDDGEGECVLYWWLNWPCRFLLKDNLISLLCTLIVPFTRAVWAGQENDRYYKHLVVSSTSTFWLCVINLKMELWNWTHF